MAVLLHRPDALPPRQAYDCWAAIGAAPAELEPAMRVPGLGEALENAFNDIASQWWKIGRLLSADQSAGLAHMPACAANLSDFGQMLAWSRLVENWTADSRNILVVTEDPWVFRHLARVSGIASSAAPRLWFAEVKLFFRGYAARVRTAIRFGLAACRTNSHRRRARSGGTAMLVYGHPGSTVDGMDGYFGTLMREHPEIVRFLHVDCPPATALTLARDGRTYSLHGWGNILAAAGLVFARWRPASDWRSHAAGWLIRRAVCREAGTAAGAAIRWQQICQRAWLRDTRPCIVAWPWENHSWEREFVRDCGRVGVATIGYQHSVVGRQMLNYAPKSNPDGLESIPGKILCSGSSTVAQLVGWGIPPDRIAIGGARRSSDGKSPRFSPDAPVFVPLPFDDRISAEMIAAVRSVRGRMFLVKEHPMSPYEFEETDSVRRTGTPMSGLDALSAVVFAASTVGLESLVAGIPTFRFRPQSCMALDILPAGQSVRVVDAATLGDVLNNPRPAAPLARDSFFAPVDPGLWRSYLETDVCDGKQA